MTLPVSADRADAVTEILEEAGETVFRIGKLTDRAEDAPSVTLQGLGTWPA